MFRSAALVALYFSAIVMRFCDGSNVRIPLFTTSDDAAAVTVWSPHRNARFVYQIDSCMISLIGERIPQERTVMITFPGSHNPFITYPVLNRLDFTQLNTYRILVGLNSGFGHHFGSMVVVPHNGSSRTISAPWADMIIRPDEWKEHILFVS